MNVTFLIYFLLVLSFVIFAGACIVSIVLLLKVKKQIDIPALALIIINLAYFFLTFIVPVCLLIKDHPGISYEDTPANLISNVFVKE
jgi:hypothetical protein